MNIKSLPLCLFCLLNFVIAFGQDKTETTVISKNYCTEIGRFDLLMVDDEIAGAYLLIHKNALGGIWGRLKGKVMTGRWHDADGKGDIILTFNDDFSFFTADYRSDEEAEKWYKDSWHGSLRPDSAVTFVSNGKSYRCE